ncbi:hypothetical protein PhCBS80983_g03531 [Powellomyces hirtus]|uniref:Thioredoxin domain-containing protein n=1 Tax=Powellomyces hirtus TaxID=109895 RepID=A0A507E259_9FUNG|nr:hypothetical protein PhCBS80983_g03531 [Powellomyces hirtus]
MVKVVVLLLLALFASVSAITAAQPSRVVELTDENFDGLVGTGQWVVEFYATWCGACKKFAPEYENLARAVHNDLPQVRIGKVDIDKNSGLASRFMVTRLPTLYHVDEKTVRNFEVGRSASTIYDYLTEEKWRKVDPWSDVTSPFSLGPRVLGQVGMFGQQLSSLGKTFMELPSWAIGAIGLGTLLVMGALGRFMAPTLPAAPTKPESKKKK